MYLNFEYADSYIRDHTAELMRAAEDDRLAKLVARLDRPIHVRIAGWLVAAATWLQGRPDRSVVRAEA